MKKTILILMLVALSQSAKLFAQDIPLEQWSNNHPEASVKLGEWVKAHPKSARLFFEWDSKHPLKSQEFVNWAIMHPKENLKAFIDLHPGWPYLDEIMKNHKVAAEEFMVWCRNHADAAKALMAHSGGLEWAGNHLYKESWSMETPGK